MDSFKQADAAKQETHVPPPTIRDCVNFYRNWQEQTRQKIEAERQNLKNWLAERQNLKNWLAEQQAAKQPQVEMPKQVECSQKKTRSGKSY